ncbi:MAG: six-hairpin glycosidase, partial [Bacteroidetes bacterium HGW-Bacteroidetes-22]
MNRYFSLVILIIALSSCKTNKNNSEADYPVTPVDFTRVTVNDRFWSPRLDTNRLVTIRYAFNKSEETGRINNFAVAGGLIKGKFAGIRYNDSDVFKIMEGASYALMVAPDRNLELYLDSLIPLIAAAQEDDGYLYTCRTINPDSVPGGAGEKRWSNLKDSHELYNIGHMYEAAAAHYQATGRHTFLDVALKSADLVCKTFGPGKDQLHGVSGHQEIEIGLVKLYRLTHEKRYLDMARYFLDQRGNAASHELYTYGADGGNKDYTQDHMPVVGQTEAVGHAVRAAYMYSAMTDIAALTGDEAYNRAVMALWKNVTGKKMYITGGIGSRYDGEAFGADYELPDLSAYCETCAAIAQMLWSQRMFLLTGEAGYIDVLERTLYNNFLAGASITGSSFFYPNPLESDGSHFRSPWFDCACCPTNVSRFMPSLPGYIYAIRGDEIYTNLYMGNKARLEIDGEDVVISQQTNYPWDGKVIIGFEKTIGKRFKMALRIPGWARNEAVPSGLYRFLNEDNAKVVVKVNDELQELSIKDGYLLIQRVWKPGDAITIEFPMPVRTIIASDSVADHRGKLCMQRGPLVYAAEWVDNGGKVRNLMVDRDIKLSTHPMPGIADGVVALQGHATALSLDAKGNTAKASIPFTAIPYYAWAYRGTGEMTVWLPFEETAAHPALPPTIASQCRISASWFYDRMDALNDLLVPVNSNDHNIPRITFWSHKGTEEWVQYDLKVPTTLSAMDVYWFDDGPDGGCRIPASWKLQYLEKSGQWTIVTKHGDWPVKKDQWCHITFVPVTTSAVRLL